MGLILKSLEVLLQREGIQRDTHLGYKGTLTL